MYITLSEVAGLESETLYTNRLLDDFFFNVFTYIKKIIIVIIMKRIT